jgi:hypothetical protein
MSSRCTGNSITQIVPNQAAVRPGTTHGHGGLYKLGSVRRYLWRTLRCLGQSTHEISSNCSDGLCPWFTNHDSVIGRSRAGSRFINASLFGRTELVFIHECVQARRRYNTSETLCQSVKMAQRVLIHGATGEAGGDIVDGLIEAGGFVRTLLPIMKMRN